MSNWCHTYPDGEGLTVSYNSMGLPAKLTSSSAGDLVDGTTDVSAISDAVSYDAAGRLTAMRMPAGGNLWQTRGYYGWTATDTTYPGNGNGRLSSIHVGTTNGGLDRLNLANYYDSYGNVKRHYDNSAYNTFTYNDQNQVTGAYGKAYTYDVLGRLSNYEGTAPTLNTTFPGYMPKFTSYTFDANGNTTARPGQTLVWDVQNRAQRAPEGSQERQHRHRELSL